MAAGTEEVAKAAVVTAVVERVAAERAVVERVVAAMGGGEGG